jgi:tetratricopeptide (TPR) repeat protein
LLLLLGRRWRGPLLLWLAWLTLLVPALGLTEHPMYACDRYASLPGLVPAALAGAAVLWLGTTPVRRRVVALSAAALLALLGGLAHVQAHTWRDSVTLFGHMLPLVGDHPIRVQLLGRLGEAYVEQGRYAAALAPLRQAALLAPEDTTFRSNLAFALWRTGRATEAIPHLELAVRISPSDPEFRCQLAAVLADAGRPEDARREALTVLRHSPGAPCARQVLGFIAGPRGP